MCAGINRILNADGMDGIIIHPACVYATGHNGHFGLLARNIETARRENRVTAIGDGDIALPLVHADDLADLYRLALCHAKPKSSWFGVGINGVSNHRLAQLIANHFGHNDCKIETITTQTAIERMGSWAAGLAHHQVMQNHSAICDLGWSPTHQNIETDIRSITDAVPSPRQR
jgi:nucleoside-diphosphate-sugar epimerase